MWWCVFGMVWCACGLHYVNNTITSYVLVRVWDGVVCVCVMYHINNTNKSIDLFLVGVSFVPHISILTDTSGEKKTQFSDLG